MGWLLHPRSAHHLLLAKPLQPPRPHEQVSPPRPQLPSFIFLCASPAASEVPAPMHVPPCNHHAASMCGTLGRSRAAPQAPCAPPPPTPARPRALTRTHTPCAGLLFAQSVRRGSSSPRRGRAPSTSSPPWPQRVRSSWELRGSGVRGEGRMESAQQRETLPAPGAMSHTQEADSQGCVLGSLGDSVLYALRLRSCTRLCVPWSWCFGAVALALALGFSSPGRFLLRKTGDL